jgi:rod shape-determining protein MreD
MTLLQAPNRPLDPWRWLAWPAVLSVIATLVLAAPIRIFGLALPEPVFPLALAYAWVVIRPSILAPFALLLLGLFLDAFWGGPIGLWPLSLLAPYGALLGARSIMSGQSSAMQFVWWLAAAAIGLAAGYLIVAMASLTFPSLLSVFWQYLATVALYPFVARLIDRFEDADVRFR